MSIPAETTPPQITPAIAALCRSLAADQEPLYVLVSAPSDARPNECVCNVQDYAAINGGVMVLGWCIWEIPEILLNGEFHAVWQSPEEMLIDVTPKPDGETRVLFLPDPKLVWDGTTRPMNQFVPLVDWREVRAFIEATSRKMRMLKPGLNDIDEAEYVNTMMALREAGQRLIKRYNRKHAR